MPGSKFDERRWKAPFYFVQAADTQLGLIENYGDGTQGDKYPDITWEKEIELCERSVAVINRMRPKPAFFIVCGDLVDAFPDKWPEIRRRQRDDFMGVYRGLDPEIPLVCVCGNHDVGNQPTHATVRQYVRDFGDDYFSFWVGGVQMIVLNSQFYEDASQVQSTLHVTNRSLNPELRFICSVCGSYIRNFTLSGSLVESKKYFSWENIHESRRNLMKMDSFNRKASAT